MATRVGRPKTKKGKAAACGAEGLEERHGTFVFDWPQGSPVASTPFADATWLVCGECGEEELPPELIARIEAERYRLCGKRNTNAIGGSR